MSLIPLGEAKKLAKIEYGTSKAYGYCRVSKKEQAEGYSIETQQRHIEDYCRRVLSERGVSLEKCFVDIGSSAFRKDLHERPGSREMLATLKPGDHVIIDKVDRLCRSLLWLVNVANFFKSKDIHLHFIDFKYDSTNPLSEMTLHQLAIVAQLESSIKSQRVREVQDQQRRNGTFRFSTKTDAPRDSRLRCCGIRTTERDSGRKILFRIHWLEYSIAKFCYDASTCPGRLGEIRTAFEIHKWQRTFDGSPLKSDRVYPTEFKFKMRQVGTRCRQWRRYIQPVLASMGTAPYPPAVELQQQEIPWALATLNDRQEIERWDFLYLDEGHPSIFDIEPPSMRSREI